MPDAPPLNRMETYHRGVVRPSDQAQESKNCRADTSFRKTSRQPRVCIICVIWRMSRRLTPATGQGSAQCAGPMHVDVTDEAAIKIW